MVTVMKPMTWHPEEQDEKVNQHLEEVNHAPYGTILFLGIGLLCLFTFIILISIF